VGGEPREGPEGLKKLDKWAPQVLVDGVGDIGG
jgi:hypothetical protein